MSREVTGCDFFLPHLMPSGEGEEKIDFGGDMELETRTPGNSSGVFVKAALK